MFSLLKRSTSSSGNSDKSKTSATSSAKPSQKSDVDFDNEARELWKKLNLDYDSRSSTVWNPTDPIWKHPTGNGFIFVGNQTAAENINYLRALGVTHVVNCTHGFSKIPNFHEGKLQYYNFPISHWTSFVNNTDNSVIEFTKPLFDFIEDATANGGSVLVHCLAGAHRAGTTGCACLVHFAGMDVQTAISTAKKCRSIIDPIGQLPEFLKRLHLVYSHHGGSPYIVKTTSSSSSESVTASTDSTTNATLSSSVSTTATGSTSPRLLLTAVAEERDSGVNEAKEGGGRKE